MTTGSAKLWLSVLPLACALLLTAGCGGNGEQDEPDRDPSAEARERPGDAAGDEATDEEAPEELGGAAGRALQACRQLVERAPGVPEQTKRELIADCEAAAAGDEEAMRKATRAACDVVAAATAPPLLRGQVADACKRAIPGGGAGI
jgi:hypothetical protein